MATSATLLLIPVLVVFLLPNVGTAHPTLGVAEHVAAGGTVTVTGGGYTAYRSVALRWDGDRIVDTVTPDRDGAFEVSLPVPALASPGEHDLSAIDPTDATSADLAAVDALASTIVTVVDAASSATPSPGSASLTPGPSSSPDGGGAAGGGAAAGASSPGAVPGSASPGAAPGSSSPGAAASDAPKKATPPPSTSKPKPTAPPKSGPVASGALYVAINGNDGNPGSEAAPFRTVERGLDAVRAGQTLYLRGGTYVENVQASPQGQSSARILVSAYPGERPVIKGLVSISNPRYVTFNGFNVTWNTGGYDDHMFKISGGTGWVLQNSEIWGARSFADLLIAGSPHGWAVRYNVIHDTYGGESNVNRSHNIYANTNLDATGGVIERNLIYNATHGENLKLAGAGGSSGGAANVVVRYNTMVNATQPLLIGDGSRNITVTRNIMGQSAKGWVVRLYELVGSGNRVTDNVWFGASEDCYDDDGGAKCRSVVSGNPKLDPKFGSGFHPTAGGAIGYGRYAP